MRAPLFLLAGGLLLGACQGDDPASTGAGPSGDAGACAAEPDCALCCNTKNPDENELAVGYVIRACACQDDQTPCGPACKAAGNDICGEPGAAPSEACIACLNGELDNAQSACVAGADAVCQKDEACAPLLDCLRGCP